MPTFVRNTSLSRSRREQISKSNSYRRRRAKERKVFLTTYKLHSFTQSTSPKPNKVPALNLKKVVASVFKLVQTTAASFTSKSSLSTHF
uniref:Uncharacterized protein n=1 Tax=Cajanus cajan TaxID=3821 RepID=A0A151SF93_CAJCA|nr:hypothetical protein KK1_024790 [Cajanus cajan]